MKKFKTKHALSLVLVIAIMLIPGASAFTDNIGSYYANMSNASVSQKEDKRILNEQKSNIAYNNIYESFVSSDSDVIEYDDSYAGAYLNDEGKLIILIATPSGIQSEHSKGESNILSSEFQIDSKIYKNKPAEFRAAVERLQELAKSEEPDAILFQEAKYSYKYLTDLMEQLNYSCQKNLLRSDSIWSEITSFALLDDKNCISIEIRDIDDSKIERFQTEVNNSDAFCFSNSTGNVEQQATLNPGSEACRYISSSTIREFSIGYWARRHLGNGVYEYGFVTAGHGGISAGDLVYQYTNGTVKGPIGICTVSRDEATLDAAFVKTYSGYDVSTTTVGGANIYQYAYNFPVVGNTLYKEGFVTGKTSGKVTSVNASYTSGGITYTNLISADYNSDSGDSGGIVYNSQNYVVGIHVAGRANGVKGDRYLTSAERIDILLSVYP